MILQAIILMTVLMMKPFYLAEAGDCFTELGDEYGECRIQGRFKTSSLSDCCSVPNATGYTESTSWIVFPEYIFNRKKAQTSCQTCAGYLNQNSGSQGQWCFAVRNPENSYCIHEAPFSAMLPANDELDCCLWYNASGFTSHPDWQWSRLRSRWATKCSACLKDDLVACYDGLNEDDGKFGCHNPQARMARSSTECCHRQSAKAYELLERYNSYGKQCFPCPVHGRWSPWSVWSPCSTTCGQGRVRRIRACNNPTPRYGGHKCFGATEQFDDCNMTIPCTNSSSQEVLLCGSSEDSTQTKVKWSLWSDFTPCSASCGNGTQVRRRICLDLENNIYNECKGIYKEIRQCQIVPCNGGNGTQAAEGLQGEGQIRSWGPWSPCSATCGVGIHKRSTVCKPSNNSDSAEETANSGCPITTEMSLCEVESCPMELGYDPGVPIAWAVAAMAMTTLIVGFLILLCQKRRWNEKYKWCFKSPPEMEGKHRISEDSPAVPVANAPSYSISEDYRLRYGGDPKHEHARELDDDGYEIPRNNGTDSTEHDLAERSSPRLELLLEPTQQFDKNSMAINHVYEQLEFDAKEGKFSMLLPSATSTDSKV